MIYRFRLSALNNLYSNTNTNMGMGITCMCDKQIKLWGKMIKVRVSLRILAGLQWNLAVAKREFYSLSYLQIPIQIDIPGIY